VVRTPRGRRVERLRGGSTYTCQLRAFVRAARDRDPLPTGPHDSVANMRVIDAVYDRAGLRRRGT
jgi:hypothetical protein